MPKLIGIINIEPIIILLVKILIANHTKSLFRVILVL